jgi:hypothetical protein
MKKNLCTAIIALVIFTSWTKKQGEVISNSQVNHEDTTSLRYSTDTTSAMILFKPCPPCCSGSSTDWPNILVSNNFWSKSVNEKKSELQRINTPALAPFIGPQIATLQGGTDLVGK